MKRDTICMQHRETWNLNAGFLTYMNTNQQRRSVQWQVSGCLQWSRSLESGGAGWWPVERRQDLGYHCPYHPGSPLTLQCYIEHRYSDIKRGKCTQRQWWMCILFWEKLVRKEHHVPACVRVSILDLGHPLRGWGSMGQVCTAKAAFCLAIIHLLKRRGTRGGGMWETEIKCFLVWQQQKYYFVVVVFLMCWVYLSTSWNTATGKNKIINVKLKNVTLKITIPDIFNSRQVAFGFG